MLRVLLFGSVALGLVGLGYWAGYQNGQRAAVPAAASLPAPTPPPEPVVAPRADAPRWQTLLGQRDWVAVTQWLQSLRQPPTATQRAAVLKAVGQAANRDEAGQQIALLRAYLDQAPYNGPAQLLIADLMQMQGASRDALFYLLEIIAYPPDQQTAVEAERSAERILQVLRTQLSNQQNWSALVNLWQQVLQLAPANDRYRYEYAQSLMQMKRYQQALALLNETGEQGVTRAEVDALIERIYELQTNLQFEREGSKLLASAQVGRATINLLVDTGATITSLSAAALQRVDAQPAGRRISLRTASGVVTSELFWVRDLVIQGRRIEQLQVARLPLAPNGLDGLLGVDVLDRLGALSQVVPSR